MTRASNKALGLAVLLSRSPPLRRRLPWLPIITEREAPLLSSPGLVRWSCRSVIGSPPLRAPTPCPRAVADIEYALSLAAFSSACAVGNPRWWAGSASSGQGRRRSGLYHLRKALDLSSHLIRISLLPRVESTAQIFWLHEVDDQSTV